MDIAQTLNKTVLIALLILLMCKCSPKPHISGGFSPDEETTKEEIIQRTILTPDIKLMETIGIYGLEVDLTKTTAHTIDLDSDGVVDTIQYSNSMNTHHIKINGIQTNIKDYKSWIEKKLYIVDIDKTDNSIEVLFCQHFEDEEDPGQENTFLTLANNRVKKSTLFGTDYNAGTVIIKGDDTVNLYLSSCPNFNNDYYTLEDGELKKVKEISIPNPEYPNGGCPACFIGSTKVLLSNNKEKVIQDLRVGDVVLTFNFNSKKIEEAVVEEIIRIEHNETIWLYFHEYYDYPFPANYDSLVTTSDHPIYVAKKGWCSFSPSITSSNYKGYPQVAKYQEMDNFLFYEEGKIIEKVNIGHGFLNGKETMYTISKLKGGNNFFANGVLVGIEDLKRKL